MLEIQSLDHIISVGKASCSILCILVLILFTHSTSARPVSPWTLDAIATKADILVVGEVLEVTQAGDIAQDQNRWNTPLLKMIAKVQLLRTFPQSAKFRLAKDQVISLRYYAVDWKNGKSGVNSLQFPHLSQGDIYAFPLRKATDNEEYRELIDEEDFDLLVPCVREEISGVGAETGVNFLRLELAGTFSKGRYEDIWKAAKYFSNRYFSQAKNFDPVFQLIKNQAGNDEPRWLSIATASYCAMGVPRPTIVDLLEGRGHDRSQGILTAKALNHAGSQDLDARLISEAMGQSRHHAWGTAVTIVMNYSHYQAALKLLDESLQSATPEAIYIAAYVIKDKEHPLISIAIGASIRFLSERNSPEFNNLRAACELIRDFGDENDFAFLLEEIRKSQKIDRKRYQMLWQSCAYTKNPRLIPICRIVINDNDVFSDGLRFCDVAAFELQRVTGANFGLRSEQSFQEREKSIARAKEWLKNAK